MFGIEIWDYTTTSDEDNDTTTTCPESWTKVIEKIDQTRHKVDNDNDGHNVVHNRGQKSEHDDITADTARRTKATTTTTGRRRRRATAEWENIETKLTTWRQQ